MQSAYNSDPLTLPLPTFDSNFPTNNSHVALGLAWSAAAEQEYNDGNMPLFTASSMNSIEHRQAIASILFGMT